MFLVVLVWGLNFSVMKGAFQQVPPLAFTAIRFIIASALLAFLIRRLKVERDGAPLPRPVLTRLVVLGVVGNTLYQLAFILGLARTTAGNCALVLAIVPAMVAVMAVALGLEPARPRIFWGVGVGTIGVMLVVIAGGVHFSSATMTGDLLTMAAAVCWATYTVGLRTLPPGVSPLRVTTIATIAGTPGLVLAAMPDLAGLDWAAIEPRGWAALAYATFISLVGAYILWNWSVQSVGPSRTVIYTCFTPVVAAAFAWWLLGEQLRPLQGVGAALIIAGVLLTRFRPAAPAPTGPGS